MRFVLALASPARLATLRAAGVEPEVIVSDVDESTFTADSVEQLVGELARAKAHAVGARIAGDALVLGCDSLLDLDGQPLGKPHDPQVARDRWRAMRGRSGILHTGHCLLSAADGSSVERAAATTVYFADLTDEQIDAYVATGEPLAVAGAFTVDGLGGWFVDAVEGDHHNVVGVSLPVVRRLLAELGFGLSDIGFGRP